MPARRTFAKRGRFVLYLVLLVLCLLGGGGSRDDILSLLYLQPAAVLLLAAMLAIPGCVDLRSVRAPLLLLGVLTLIVALQLVPLPPSVWMELPGHARFAEAAAAARVEQPWRPVSITPDQTLASLAGLAVPAAVLVGYATLAPAHRRALLPVLLAAIFAGTLLAIAQIVGGSDSWAYLYRITNRGSAVGWFANRNHQAALLAATFPLLALWAAQPEPNKQRLQSRLAMAAVFAIFLIPMILVTGSRAGLFLTILAAAGSYFAYRRRLTHVSPVVQRYSKRLLGALVALGVALGAAAILLSRAMAWDRLIGEQQGEDVRLGNLPTYFQMVSDVFPVGSGFGSFEALYKVYEPLVELDRTYLNRAHNDLVELMITGSVPALILLLAGLWWVARTGVGAVRYGGHGVENGYARAGALVLCVFLVASLIDYPLRTGLGAAVFALAAAWLSDGSRTSSGLREPEE